MVLQEFTAALFDAWNLAVDRPLPETWRRSDEKTAPWMQAMAMPLLGCLYGIALWLISKALAVLTVPAGTALLFALIAFAASELRTSGRGLVLTARAIVGRFAAADSDYRSDSDRLTAVNDAATLLTVTALAGLKLLLLFILCRTHGGWWAGGAMVLALTLEARLAACPAGDGTAILELEPAETARIWIIPAAVMLLLAFCRPLAAVAAFLLTLWWSQWFARNRQESPEGLTAAAITLGSYALESAVLLLAAVLVR